MATTAEQFIHQFQNLKGNAVSERKKNLYLILKSTQLSPNEQKILVENLKPKNYLETVFHADILIHFKETEALTKLLKTGNEVYVSKIIKQPWFFQEVFNNIQPNQLVEEVLPKLSYCVKLKVFKKLLTLLSSDQIDDIFDVLARRYGLHLATKLLPGCSEAKIENILKTYSIILTTANLKLIHKKNPNLIKTYFHELSLRKKCDINKMCDESFYKYLAKNDPTVFWEIIEKYKPVCRLKLGRRITKKILPLAEAKVISEPNTYIKYFNQNKIVQVLNKQGKFSELYKNLFPDEITDLPEKYILINILNYYPERRRYDLFRDTFQKVFLEDVWDNKKFVNNYFLGSIEDKDLRIKWAQLKYKETNDIEYVSYYDIQTSIAFIKERINVTSNIPVRSNLISLLLKSCAVNKDMVALEQVLQYFYERHRNEDVNVKDTFLERFYNHFGKKASIFTEHVWKYFIDIVTIYISKDYKYGLSINQQRLVIQYIEYLVNKNEYMKAENAINKLFPAIFFSCNIDFFRKNFKNPEIERKMLLYTCKSIENMEKLSPRTHYYKELLEWLYKFNRQHPNKKIVFDENITDLIKRSIKSIKKSEHYLCVPICSEILCKSNLSDLEQELFQHLMEKKMINGKSLGKEPSNSLKIFRYNPALMIPHFESMIKVYLESDLSRISLWPNLRWYSHLGLDNVIKKCCLHNLSNNDIAYVKRNCIRALSYILSSNEYIQAMKDCNLFPTKYNLDSENIEETKIFEIQKNYIKMLKNTNEPSQYLPAVLEHFCRGDFLQDSLPPLYKAFYRLPEESLKPYLNILSKKKNISIQKHAAILACNVLDQPTSIQTLQMFKESKNQSIKTAVFCRALKYFCKNSSRETFDIMLGLTKFLSGQNIETLESLFSAKVDKNYIEEYLQNAWMLLETFEDNSEMNKIKPIGLKSFNQISIKNLPVDFCKDIVQGYFLSDVCFQSSEEIHQFVVNFLVSFDQEENYAFVFGIISSFKSKFWTNYKVSDRKKIGDFVKMFVKHACQKEIDTNVIIKFFKFWKDIFSLYENFEDYLLIKFAEIWKENSDPKIFSNSILKYLEEINQKNEGFVTNFASTLSEFLLLFDEKLKLDIMCNIPTASSLSCILAIELLKCEKKVFRHNKILRKYVNIDTKLKNMLDNDLVKLKYNSLLKKY